MHINTNHNSGSSLLGNALYLALPITREREANRKKKMVWKKMRKIQSVERERITPRTTERERKKNQQRNFVGEQQQGKSEFKCWKNAYFNTFNLFAPLALDSFCLHVVFPLFFFTGRQIHWVLHFHAGQYARKPLITRCS